MLGVSHREFYSRFKVNEKGELVDISTLDPQKLDALVEFYRLKSHRAHSPSMKELYAGIAEDIRIFRNSQRLPERVDAPTVSKFMGIQDVGDFIRRYWKGEVFSDEDEMIGLYRQWKARPTPYQRPSIPPDKIITELPMDSRRKKFSTILSKLAEYYHVRNPSLAIRKDRKMDYYLEYLEGPALIIINAAKLPKSENIFIALLQGFFRHLAKKRAWVFSTDTKEREEEERMIASYTVEKREAELFAARICERLVALRLMKRRE